MYKVALHRFSRLKTKIFFVENSRRNFGKMISDDTFSYGDAINRLNSLQTNFQLLSKQIQERGQFSGSEFAKVRLENNKKNLAMFHNGELEEKLKKIKMIHIAGTKVI
jgi:predicted metal-dependent hydrolase